MNPQVVDLVVSFALTAIFMIVDRVVRQAASREKGWELPEEPSLGIFLLLAAILMGAGFFATYVLGGAMFWVRFADSPLAIFFYLGATRRWPFIARFGAALVAFLVIEILAMGVAALVVRLHGGG